MHTLKTWVQIQDFYLFCWIYKHRQPLSVFKAKDKSVALVLENVPELLTSHFMLRKKKKKNQRCLCRNLQEAKAARSPACPCPPLCPHGRRSTELKRTRHMQADRLEKEGLAPACKDAQPIRDRSAGRATRHHKNCRQLLLWLFTPKGRVERQFICSGFCTIKNFRAATAKAATSGSYGCAILKCNRQ